MSEGSPRPLTTVVWLLVVSVLIVGGYRLFHLSGRSHDQQILIEKSKH